MRDAVVSSRQVPSSCHTSGMGFRSPFSSSPEVTSISPLGNAVLVGYQRPRAICGPCVHWPVRKSNKLALGKPWSLVMLPPVTKSRPSASSECPPQKMSIGWGAFWSLPVAGSQTVGSPLWPQVSTRPSGRRWEWIATTGQAFTSDQLPNAAGSGVGGGGGGGCGGGGGGAVVVDGLGGSDRPVDLASRRKSSGQQAPPDRLHGRPPSNQAPIC